MSLEAVFFDFDGVIADTEPIHLRAYQTVLGREGIDLTREDYYARYLGYDDEGLFRTLSADLGVGAGDDRIDGWIAAKSALVEEMLASDSILFPGAADCVRRLAARVPLVIASGALEPEIDFVLTHAGLRECFHAIASASDGVRGKPAPDLYLLAMAKLHDRIRVNPRACIAIEDSHWGLEAAARAGLRCVAVTHTYPRAELPQAELVVDRLEDLTADRVDALLSSDGMAG